VATLMRVAVISANLGAYDLPVEWTPQVVPAGVTVAVHRFDDSNFPPRPKAMTPALQVGLLKWFGPEFVPGADVYLWVDASCALLREDSVAWFVEQLGSAGVAAFRHPERNTIRAEYDFIKARLGRPNERYLTKRYAGEWLDEQFGVIEAEGYADVPLYATTAIVYRPKPYVLEAFKEVWYGKSRYHLHDQLWFARTMFDRGTFTLRIDANYLTCDYLTYVRNRKTATS
jgi:hypothetical protein